MREILDHWRKGVRLYIGIGIVLVTLEVWWWASASYSGSVLFATRLEEAYAWLAVGLICSAVTIGPLYKVFPRLGGKGMLFDARRLIGVGAAWFASLHVAVAYVSLFKLANPLHLPRSYQQAFVVGALALIILLAMAVTSFDKALKTMGIWWFRLHRLVYVALLLILLHAFLIGVHATQWPALIILTVVAVGLLSLHIYISFVRQERPTIGQLLTISYVVLLLVALFNYGYGQKLGYNPIEGKHAARHE
ncbi:MAG: ferric reductase-like transmembrane domain-containing protein [Candidatus Saccharimonadales bacterium]